MASAKAPGITVLRTPDGGIQPVAEVDADGNVHLLYFRGEPGHGDLFHTVRRHGADGFEESVRVNTTAGSALAIGTIRGAQMAIGRAGHVHVAWMGSGKTLPQKNHHLTPMLYTRSTDGGKTFEPERNLITASFGLDGGGAVAADRDGRIDVFWHAGKPDAGEEGRQIWVSRSRDDGKTFAPEVPVWGEATGVCGCCGMTAAAGAGQFWVMYRSATEKTHRDIYLLHSAAAAGKVTGERLDQWETESCPMSAMALGFAGMATAAAWETSDGTIAFAMSGTELRGRVSRGATHRKYPDIAVAPDGHVLLAWIDGAGWNKGGRLAWQMFDGSASPVGEPETGGKTAVWTKPAAVFDGTDFLIVF